MGDSAVVSAVSGIVGVLAGFAATTLRSMHERRLQHASSRAFVLAAFDDLYNLVRLVATPDHYYPKSSIQRAIDVLNQRLADKDTASAFSADEYGAISRTLAMTQLRLYAPPEREYIEGYFGEHLKPENALSLVRHPMRLFEETYETLQRHQPPYPFT